MRSTALGVSRRFDDHRRISIQITGRRIDL